MNAFDIVVRMERRRKGLNKTLFDHLHNYYLYLIYLF